MNETWCFAPGRGIWSLRRRCDEARLHFYFAKIKVRLGQALAAHSPPDCGILFSSHRHRRIKKKQMHKHLLLFYGAGDEARTRYLHLGKVALYRMSYTRGTRSIIAQV